MCDDCGSRDIEWDRATSRQSSGGNGPALLGGTPVANMTSDDPTIRRLAVTVQRLKEIACSHPSHQRSLYTDGSWWEVCQTCDYRWRATRVPSQRVMYDMGRLSDFDKA